MAIGLSLAILGACLLVGQVSVTLKVTRAAPAQESNAAAAIYALHPVVVRLGSVVGAAGAVGMAAIALAALRRGRRLDAALLVPCAAGVLAAAWPFGRGWAENLAVDQMPRSGTVGAIDALVGGVLPGLQTGQAIATMSRSNSTRSSGLPRGITSSSSISR